MLYDNEAGMRAYEESRGEENGVSVIHHEATYSPTTALPQSLMGKVRVALGESPDQFAIKLGLSK
jgi:hypothetical protein